MALLSVSARDLDAAILDLDGVVTDTAAVHELAWRSTFAEFFAQQPAPSGEPQPPLSSDDYLRFVDGKPRYDGARDFLRSRSVALPWGDPADPPGASTVCGIGNRKDQRFAEHLGRSGVRVFGGTVELVRRMRACGMTTAIVSASKHAREVLAAGGLTDLFAECVDGVEAERLGLAGKPDPAAFREAARRLGVPPDRAVVVEDALAGVEAGRAGGFGLVVGVARGRDRAALQEHGADVVVDDLGEISVRVSPSRASTS